MSRVSRTPVLPARGGEGRILGGVCAGIARALAVDVTLVRLAFLVLILAWGLGLLLYLGLWLLMPDSGRDAAQGWRRQLRQRARGMRVDLENWSGRIRAGWGEVGRDPWPRPIGRRWMAILLIAGGAIALLASLGAFSWLTPLRAASIAMVLVGAGVLINMRN